MSRREHAERGRVGAVRARRSRRVGLGRLGSGGSSGKSGGSSSRRRAGRVRCGRRRVVRSGTSTGRARRRTEDVTGPDAATGAARVTAGATREPGSRRRIGEGVRTHEPPREVDRRRRRRAEHLERRQTRRRRCGHAPARRCRSTRTARSRRAARRRSGSRRRTVAPARPDDAADGWRRTSASGTSSPPSTRANAGALTTGSRCRRGNSGATTNTPTSADNGVRCRACIRSATAMPASANRPSAATARRSAAWSHADATSVSWSRCTTCTPRAAATRPAGSVLSCSYQRAGTVGSSVGRRPVGGAVARRGQHGRLGRDLVRRVEHLGQRGGEPGRQRRVRPRRPGRRRAPAARRRAGPGRRRCRPGRARRSRDRSAVNRSVSGTVRPRMARASDWKSPAGPVAKRQWWYTGSSTGPMSGASVHAGPCAPAGSSPSPARRPDSNVGTTHARYSVCSVSSRPHTRRDRLRAGSPPSAAVSAEPSVPVGATWACAHAHESARSGSSTSGRAGGPIRSTGSGLRAGWVEPDAGPDRRRRRGTATDGAVRRRPRRA